MTQTVQPHTDLGSAARRNKPLLIQARVDLCPIKESAKMLGKKWYLVIIHRLLGKRMGFNELKEAVGDISAKILSQALQDLQEKAVVERRVASESPVRVEYRLTDKGEDLRYVLQDLYDWGKKWAICKDEASAAERDTGRFRSSPGAGVVPSETSEPVASPEPSGAAQPVPPSFEPAPP